MDSSIASFALVAALVGLILYGIISTVLKNLKFKDSLTKGVNRSTKSGVLVQSYGEEVLADFFHEHKIRFIYDKSTRFSFFQPAAIRPDFYLPDYDVYVEYWGMKGNAAYDKKTTWKKKVYARYHKRLIDIWVPDIKSKRYIKKFQEFGIQ